MQPSPRAETSRPLFPSLRFCIVSPLNRSFISRLGSGALEAVSRSFRFIAYSSCTVDLHTEPAVILERGERNRYHEKPRWKGVSVTRSSARIADGAGSQDCLVHWLRREPGNGHSRADAPSADRPHRSVLDDLRAGRDRDRPGAKARGTRPKHFHLRCVAIPADVDRFAGRQPGDRGERRGALPAMSLKLEMPVVRELLSREEIQVAEAPSDSPGMATGETTVEFLSACCRLVDLLDTPQDIPFLSGLIQREIIYRILRSAGGSAPSSDCNAGRAEPPDGKSDRLDQGELREAAAGGRSRRNRGHGRFHAASSFPGADRDESSAVSEAASVAGSAGTHADGWSGRRQRGL